MTKGIKTLIISLGALALLGGGYFGSTLYSKKKAEEAFAARTPVPKLGNLDNTKLVKIETEDITLEKKGELWELTSLSGNPPPAGLEIDQNAINSMTYSLASVWVESVVEENPQDISTYGLDNPSARASVTDSDGKRVEYIRGDVTPSRTTWYVMEAGDPKVYTVSSYTADSFAFTLDTIRVKSMFPVFDYNTLAQVKFESPETRFEINLKPDILPTYLTSAFTSYLVTSPFKLARGVDGETLSKFIEPLNSLRIIDFVEDNPSSLVPYGLDWPVKLFVKSKEGDTLDLLVGSRINENRYAKLAGSPGVFTLGGLDPIVETKPFSMIDKFALILNIDLVERLTVTGGPQPLEAELQGTGDEAVFFLNEKKAESKSFRSWYQAVIGLLADAEIPDPVSLPASEEGNITVEYHLNTFPGARASLTLVPYNRDFYALSQEGTVEFLISRNQVNQIWETADAVVFE